MSVSSIASRIATALVLFLVLLAMGCGGAGTPSQPVITVPPTPVLPGFAYVINQDSDTVSAFAVDATTGALTPVPGSPFPTDSTPVGLAADPAGNFLYVTNALGPSISAYAINSTTGALTQIPGSPFGDDSPVAIAIDPAGKFAYVANFGSRISTFSIAANGGLTPVGVPPATVGDWRSLTIVDGRLLYAPDANANLVAAFSIDAIKGSLTPLAASPFADDKSPWSVVADPSGKFLYLADAKQNAVSAFSIDATGALIPLAGSPFAADAGPTSIAMTPNGKFIYTADSGANNVFGFAVSSTGALSPVPRSPFATPARAFGLTVDPSGKFVYVAETGQSPSGDLVPGDVAGFAIGPDGALGPVPGSPFPAGLSARAVVVIKKAQ